MADPWERREGETSKAYSAFIEYLKLLREERTFLKAYRVYSGVTGASKTPGFFKDWANQYSWTERAGLYDDHILDHELKDLEKQRKEARVRQAKLGREIQLKGREILDRTDDLNAASGTSMIMAGQKIENLALGVPTEINKQEVNGHIEFDPGERARRILADPVAARLACELTERLGAGKADPGGVRDAREPGQVDAGKAPCIPEP